MKEKELINKLIELKIQSEKDSYNKSELNRHLFLKEKLGLDESEIVEDEIKSKKKLFDFLLKYKNRKSKIDLMHNFINLEYLDLMREFINLNRIKIDELEPNKKEVFKVFSKNIVSLIPKKSVNKFNEKGHISNENYLFFLKMNEDLLRS
jgi:hypothetical protein